LLFRCIDLVDVELPAAPFSHNQCLAIYFAFTHRGTASTLRDAGKSE
jgi:hypothetical protein